MPSALAFISHSAEDKRIATQLAEALRMRDIEIWIDHEQIRFGDSIPGKIAEGLRKCDAILVLASASFLNSSWCRAEYEPLLAREIKEGRTVVIPLRTDDSELPVLLSAKRYGDLRAGLTEALLDELAAAISEGKSVATVNRLLPKRARSYECSLLAMIISGVIHDFPVAVIGDAEILEPRSLIDLYRTIETLIGRYEEVCREIMALLEESEIRDDFYGSGWRVQPARLASANRSLVGIAKDMREISASLNNLLPPVSPLRARFLDLLNLCVSISVAEDFLILMIGAPATLPTPPKSVEDQGGPWRPSESQQQLPIYDNALAPNYFDDLGAKMVADFGRVLDEIERYRGELRREVARLASTATR